MSRRRQLVLEEADSPVAVSGTWVLYVHHVLRFSICISGPDGLLCPQIPELRIDRKYMEGGFVIDPRDVEVEIDSILGRGAGGIVTRAVHKPTGTPLAIKQVQLNDRGKREQLMNDIRTLIQAQNCEYLVRLYAAYFHEQSGRVHVALELMDVGSLEDVLKRVSGPIPERFIPVLAFQIVKGLQFLHSHKQLHRDIKPGNILLNSSGCVKLSDFGISKTLDNTTNMCDTFVGTATYMSPERALGKDYSFSSDIWSLGMVLFEVASGKFPFPTMASFPVLFDHLCNRPEPRLSDCPSLSPELQDLVSLCLQRDPLRRPTASQLLEHPFLDSHTQRIGALAKSEFSHWLQSLICCI